MTVKKTTQRHRLVVSALGAAALLLAACGGTSAGDGDDTSNEGEQAASEDGEAVELSFMHKWPEPQYAPLFEQIVADYEDENPNVTIEIEAIGDQPIKDKLQVLTTANELPDIYFSWAGDFTKLFVRAGFAADITDAVLGTDWGDRVASAGWDAYTYDDRVYGMPINLDGKFFVYNTALFEEHGLDVPETLDDLYGVCDALNAAGLEPIAFGNQFGWPAIHYLTTLNGRYVPGDVLDADYVPESAEWEHPGYEQALATLDELADRCLTPDPNGIPHDDAVSKVLTGRAAMVFVQSVEFDKFTEARDAPEEIVDNWSFFGFPTIDGAEGDQQSLTGAPDGFLVNAESPHIDQATDFLSFLTNHENGTRLVSQMGRLSSVEGTATEDNSTPQLRAALEEIQAASSFNIWLDTVTHTQVASAYLSGGEALLGGSSTPSEVMESVKNASESAAS